MKRYILKSVIIGLSATVVGFATTRALTGNRFPKLDDKDIKLRLFNYFISAVILHTIFRFSGVNAKFCEYN